MIVQAHPDVKMDDCHIELISSLVKAAKPKSILEIGVGTGACTVAIVEAAKANSNGAEITLVDGFNDWDFKEPEGFERVAPHVNFVQAQEKDFILSASAAGRKFDFIISDADHAHTGEWAAETVSLVADGGILIFHDACLEWPSVLQAEAIARQAGMSALLFNKSSHPWERCERTLCVLQKP